MDFVLAIVAAISVLLAVWGKVDYDHKRQPHPPTEQTQDIWTDVG